MRWIIFVILLMLSGCLTSSGGGSKVVFDLSHRQAFQPVDLSTLGFTALYEMFNEEGLNTQASTTPITTESLEDVGVLVIAGPLAPLTDEENSAVLNYVAGGGDLLILLHIAQPVVPLMKNLDILTTTAPIAESSNIIGGNPGNFYAMDINDHPLTEGVDSIAVYGSWGLGTIKDDADILARTTPGAWIDFNRDGAYQDGEFMDTYGILAVREFGRGRAVVLADDAVLTDQFLDQGDNRRLAENIVNYLS